MLLHPNMGEEDKRIPPYAPKDLAERIVDRSLVKEPLQLPMLISGGCAGADDTFGEEAMKAGHSVVHMLGPGDEEWCSDKAKAEQSSAFYDVSGELLDGPIVTKAFQKASDSRVLLTQRKEGWEQRVENMAAKRNLLQVNCADVVFAVGWRLQPGKDQFTGREDVDKKETPVLDVGGGTGWGCQWYVDRFGKEDADECKLYFFDDGGPPWALQDELTSGKWNRWDVQNECWVPLHGDPPPPAGLYAGIGGTRLSEKATEVIHALYSGAPASAAAET